MRPRTYERRRFHKMDGPTVGESICDMRCAHHSNRNLTARRVVGFDLERMDSPSYMKRIVGERY